MELVEPELRMAHAHARDQPNMRFPGPVLRWTSALVSCTVNHFVSKVCRICMQEVHCWSLVQTRSVKISWQLRGLHYIKKLCQLNAHMRILVASRALRRAQPTYYQC